MGYSFNPFTGNFDNTGVEHWQSDSPGIRYTGHIAVGADADVDGTGPVNSVLQEALGVGTMSNVQSIQEIMTGTPATYNNGLEIKVVSDFSSTPTTLTAAEALAATASGNATDVNVLAGFFGGSIHRGTGTVTAAYALPGLIYNMSTGTMTTATGILGQVNNAGAGTIDTSYAIKASVGLNNGTVTNSHGVYIEGITAATNNYGLTIEAASTNTVWISNLSDSTTASGGIVFGASKDTNLYRSAADTLKTDDKLVVSDKFNQISAANNAFGSATGLTGVQLSVLTTSASRVGLTIQGHTSQSANLQEWQNSSGTVLTSISSAGYLNSPRFKENANGVVIGGASTPVAGTNVLVESTGGSNKALVVKGYSGQTANLQEWRNSANTLLSSINSDGALQLVSTETIRFGAYATGLTIEASDGLGSITFKSWGTTLASFGLSSASIYAPIAFTSPLIINGSSTSDVDIRTGYWYWNLRNNHTSSDAFQIVNETGANSIPLSISKYSTTTLQNRDASYQALIVKGYTSQTANLQEWQNSSGTVLSGINSSGYAFFGKSSYSSLSGSTPGAIIQNGNGVALEIVNTASSGSAGGAGIVGYSNDGAANASGDRLGYYLGGGMINASTAVNNAGMTIWATENYSATNQGGEIRFETTPNGSTTASRVARVRVPNNVDGFDFGAAFDTNLYRSAADTLKTDDSLIVGTDLEIDGALDHDGTTAGLYGVTPVTRATTGIAEATFTENAGGTAVNVDSTFGGYTLQQVVQALQDIGILT